MRNRKGKSPKRDKRSYHSYLAIVIIFVFIGSSAPIPFDLLEFSQVSIEEYDVSSVSTIEDDDARAEYYDIMISFFGVKEDPSYSSVDINYTPFCQVKNRNETDVTGVFVHLAIYNENNGTEVYNSRKTISSIAGGVWVEVLLDTWHPTVEAHYGLYFEANFSSAQYVDLYPPNNYAKKYMFIQKKIDISIDPLEISPEKGNYTYGDNVQIDVSVKNNALSPVDFTLYACIKSEGSHIPLEEYTANFSLAHLESGRVELFHTFSKISTFNISATVYVDGNNQSPFGNRSRLVKVLRLEPPVPKITLPKSNIPFFEGSPLYYSDAPITLDGSDSTWDTNLSGLTYTWTSSLSDVISNKKTDSVNLIIGIHEITLTVYDGLYTRSTSSLIKVDERGIVSKSVGAITAMVQYVGGEGITLGISGISEPGPAWPKEASLEIFRRILIDADSLPESLQWMNISIDYQDHMVVSGETITDESTIEAWVYNDDLVSWELAGDQGIIADDDILWLNISSPELVTTVGVFSDYKLTVAKFAGMVFHDANKNYKHDSGETLLKGVRVFFDRGRHEDLTDEQGRYSFTLHRSDKYDVAVAKSGYVQVQRKVTMTVGKIQYENFGLRVKTGTVNGTVVEAGNKENTIANVTVSLIPVQGLVDVYLMDVYEGTTNETGNFSISNVPTGDYKLVLTPMGEFISGGLDKPVSIDHDRMTDAGLVPFWRFNNPPEIELISIEPGEGYEGDFFTFIIQYSDPDGDPGDVYYNVINDDILMMLITEEPDFKEGVRYMGTWRAREPMKYKVNFRADDIHNASALKISPGEITVKEPTKEEDAKLPKWAYGVIFLVILIIVAVIVYIFLKSKKEEYFCPECGFSVGLDDFECAECGEELPDFTELEEEEWEEEEEEEDTDYDSYTSIKIK